jgi:hypothetical protein
MSDSWSDLMAGSLDKPAADKLLRRGLADIEHVLQAQPRAYDDLVAIVEKNLSLPWDEGTITTLSDTLESYLRSDAGQILLWIAYDRTARLEQLSKFDSPQALELIRRISASYGRHLGRAIQVSNGWRDDWDWISLSVSFDQGNSTYRLRFDLTKVTGERIRIESPPDSLMALSTYLLGMLRDVGSREAFTETVRQGFSDRLDEVQKVLRAAPAPGDSTTPQAVAQPATTKQG